MSDTSDAGGRAPGRGSGPASACQRAPGGPDAPKLSSPAIVAAAIALLDREGADALTMRRLGAELGVEAMSLYRHVASRGALLDAIAERPGGRDRAAGATAPIGPRRCAPSPASFARSPAATPRRSRSSGCACSARPARSRPLEDVLASLRSGGFTPARAISAYRLVIAYARGYALSEIAGFAVEASSPEGQPAIRSLSRRLASEPTEVGFRAGLETILGGLRIERAAGRAAAVGRRRTPRRRLARSQRSPPDGPVEAAAAPHRRRRATPPPPNAAPRPRAAAARARARP